MTAEVGAPPQSTCDTPNFTNDQPYDVAVIGGGVVGLSTLRTATLCGLRCILLEAKADLLDGASGRNSGIACTGVDAPVGSLERALIRDSISSLRGHLVRYNVPHRCCGSMVCLWPWDGEDVSYVGVHDSRLEAVAKESWDAGDSHCKIYSKADVLDLEPHISKEVRGGVHIPGEIVLDPFLLPLTYAVHARENGAHIVNNFVVDGSKSYFDDQEGIWSITSSSSSDVGCRRIFSKSVVNATGIMADWLERDIRKASSAFSEKTSSSWESFESRPRRGQYCIFSSPNQCLSIPVPVRPIQPVPSQRTKGVFVYSTIYNQIVVGPTALDQEDRNDDRIDHEVGQTLKNLAKRVIPICNPETDLIDEWVGLRPATNYRDYQIHLYPEKRFITAAGIRSTGLTASLGIGRYVIRLLSSIVHLPPDGKQHLSSICEENCSALPNIINLMEQYQNSGDDGTICVNGYEYKVTHPITRNGWRCSKHFEHTC